MVLKGAKKTQAILKYLALYLTIAGLVTFALFICEEAYQTAMFGTWPARDASEWAIVNEGLAVMETSVDVMETINKWAGWIQPIAYISYDLYATSARYHMKALRSLVMAHAPELFLNEIVTINIKGKPYTILDSGARSYTCGQIKVMTQKTDFGTSVSGTLRRFGDQLFVDEDL